MSIIFSYPTSKTAYSWIGNRILNPSYNPLNDPFVTFGANPLIDNFSGYKYMPTSLDMSIARYKESFIKDVNGNPNYNDPIVELADKNWNKTVQPITPDSTKINLIDNQWSNVINTSGFNEKVNVAYVNGITPAGETYVGGGVNSNDNVILINAGFLDYSTQDLSLGTWGGWMLMHELGHVYGVFHGVDDEALNQRPELLKMSIMWYPQKGNYAEAKIPLTPGMADIDAMQLKFGESRAQDGNTQYIFGQGSVDLGHGNVLAGVTSANLKNYVMTLWDSPDAKGGIDTIDASTLSTRVYIDLRAGHFSAIGTDWNQAPDAASADLNGDGDPDGDTKFNVGIANLAQIENAKGGAVDDYLQGNYLNNKLEGNGGNDTLDGSAGNDYLLGGSGNDTYLFKGAAYGIDTIEDSDGTIIVDGQTLSGGEYKFESIYKNEGTRYQYIKVNGGADLLVLKQGDANRIIINNCPQG